MSKIEKFELNTWDKLSKHKHFVSLEYIHKVIISNRFKKEITYIRFLNSLNDTETAKSIKKNMPSFTVSGIFDETKARSKENLIEYTGLMILDIDKLGTKEKVLEIFNQIIEIEYTLMAFISPTGFGIKVIVATNNNEVENHTLYYKRLLEFYKSILNVDFDNSTCDVARLCFFSHDPNAYFNPKSKEYIFEDLSFYNKTHDYHEKKTETIPDYEIFELKMREITNFTSKVQIYSTGNRNNFVHLLAKNCNGFGLKKTDIENFIISKYSENDFTEEEIQSSIDSAYKINAKDFGKWKTKLNQLINLRQKDKKMKKNDIQQEKLTYDKIENYYIEIFEKNVTKDNYDKFLSDDNFCWGVISAIEAIARNDFKKIV